MQYFQSTLSVGDIKAHYRRWKYNKKVDLNGLAQSYGYQSFESEERTAINGS
jgi:hypothetical protein